MVLIYVFFGGMRGTAWANTFQTIVFMVLGVVTFVVISSKLGGLDAASHAVLEKNPSKLMRAVDPADRERYAERYQTWTLIAKYNYARRILKTLKLTEEQKLEAYNAFKPRFPNWQTTAEAVYAAKNELYKLSNEQINKALLTGSGRSLQREKVDYQESTRRVPRQQLGTGCTTPDE